MDDERRTIEQAQIRAAGDETNRRITGYAAVFNALSEDLGGFREVIRPGAFAETIRRADVRALWNHDPNYVLGRTTNGTLKLKEDDHGLAFDLKLPSTQWARDAWISIERGDVDQMSFGFCARSANWISQHGDPVRELLAVDLFDVSPVTYPAYPMTSAEARDMAASLSTAAKPLENEVDPPGQEAGQDPAIADDAQGRAVLNDWRLRLSEFED